MNELVKELFPQLASPAAILVVGYFIKAKLGQLDKMPDIIMEQRRLGIELKNQRAWLEEKYKAMDERKTTASAQH